MPFEDVLVHTGTPIRTFEPDPEEEGGTGRWVEGEWVEDVPDEPGETGPPVPVRGTPFDCCLFLPKGEEGAGAGASVVILGGRQVTRPTLLLWPEDRLGAVVALDREDEVGIVAPELNVVRGLPPETEEIWMVDGDPQPFGPPGDDVIGLQATLTRVRE